MGSSETFTKVKPYVAMVFLQFGYAGMYIIVMVSLKRGMNHYVLVVYRNAIAAAVIAPFAFFLERKVRPKMTLSIFLKIMALGLLEPVLDQNFYYVGSKCTSASFSAALFNILPAITFVLAIIFRMEKIKLKSPRSQAKIIGTLVTIAGALVMIMYKGPILDLFHNQGHGHHDSAGSPDEANWLKGTLMLLASCVCWSSFYILQASHRSHTLMKYPVGLSLTTLICFMGAAQATAVALVMEREASAWTIHWDARIFAAIYSGVVCSGITYYVQGIVLKERGPVFVTAFNPLCLFIVAILGSIILKEEITLGRVIGAIIIVIGLYSIIWGKSKDHIASSYLEDKKKGSLALPVAATGAMKPSSNNSVTSATNDAPMTIASQI
ncbi:WAT1-related protein [Acorus gramineus]|uniref:WAT1-related protein n=1 Tax=Acorus gramineus TaxID=55184 RepID=A0AAV9BS27_ACOGR|nr:WAT1-related protein [Acorus gramineus]